MLQTIKAKFLYLTAVSLVAMTAYFVVLLLAIIECLIFIMPRWVKPKIQGLSVKISFIPYFVISAIAKSTGNNVDWQHLIRSSKEPTLFVCNHQSLFETFIFHYLFHPTSHIIKKQVAPNKLSVNIFNSITSSYIITLERNNKKKDIRNIREVSKKIFHEKNTNLIFYPEGTRVLPGQYKKMSTIFSIIAKDNQVPVVVVTHNFGMIFDRQKKRVNFDVPLEIKMSKPFYLSNYTDEKSYAKAVSDLAQKQVTSLLNAEYQETRMEKLYEK